MAPTAPRWGSPEHALAAHQPVAAATVLNVFLFALVWRGHKIERASGTNPKLIFAGLLAYGAAVAVALWVLIRTPTLTSYGEIFVSAVGAEMAGGIIVFAILNALFFTRGQGAENRAGPLFLAVLMAVMLIGSAFY